MTPDERADIEALAATVCPHTYRGVPCDEPAGHSGSRHWNAYINWPGELSDRLAS